MKDEYLVKGKVSASSKGIVSWAEIKTDFEFGSKLDDLAENSIQSIDFQIVSGEIVSVKISYLNAEVGNPVITREIALKDFEFEFSGFFISKNPKVDGIVK